MKEYLNGHYYSLNQYLRETFGCKVYKLALKGGYTCPNRDGTAGFGGCIFCSEGGSGEFTPDACLSVSEQIEAAKARVGKKFHGGKYIAYFQSFTTTYMPIDRLDSLLSQAISDESVIAVSVGTRPDCLPDKVAELLSRYNAIKPVWVELGLQTIHEKSAKYIRRGYPLSVYDEAAARLRSLGINVITHVIIGIPNESKSDIVQTVRHVGRTADGIKLQLLHVLKNTDLADEYARGSFSVLSREEYFDILCSCIEALPENVVIHRLTGDGDKRLLIAPLWSGDKKGVLNALNRELDSRNIIQAKGSSPDC